MEKKNENLDQVYTHINYNISYCRHASYEKRREEKESNEEKRDS